MGVLKRAEANDPSDPAMMSQATDAARTAQDHAAVGSTRGTSGSRPRMSAANARNIQETARGAGRGATRHDVDAFGGSAEPAMVDVLNEPIVLSLMRRDGVPMESLQRVIGDAEAYLQARCHSG